ncbi:MAG: MmgE/PrpD family protein [Chloroflexi bacterium]|nr:MmgE/PrpD family protein [Chloroflexota bacterium]
MTSIHPATASLVEYAIGNTPATLPPELTRAGLNILLDTLAATIGARAPWLTISAPLLRYAAIEGGDPRASIFGSPRKTGPALAALVNGTLAYALDIESIHGPSITHAAAVVVPAALVVAEANGCSGADLLRAIIIGLDAGGLHNLLSSMGGGVDTGSCSAGKGAGGYRWPTCPGRASVSTSAGSRTRAVSI